MADESKTQRILNADIQSVSNAFVLALSTICARLHYARAIDAGEMASVLRTLMEDPALTKGALEKKILETLAENLARIGQMPTPPPGGGSPLQVLRGGKKED